MNEKEAIQLYLTKGKLLHPDALKFLHDNPISVLPETESIVLSVGDFEKQNWQVTKCITELKEVNAETTINYYNSRYTKLRKILVERLKKDFTSLNKLPNNGEIWTIGIVRDVFETNTGLEIELEDPTKTQTVIFREKVICNMDDVVAINAEVENGNIIGKKVVYPDVPLRQATLGKGKMCIISDLNLNLVSQEKVDKFSQSIKEVSNETDYIFFCGDIGDKSLFEKITENCKSRIFVIPGEMDDKTHPRLPMEFSNKKIVSLSNPSEVLLGGVRILSVYNFDVSFLKKRHLGVSPNLAEDFLVIEETPDIVACGHSDKPYVNNYKSITIANSGSMLGEFAPIIIDLSTREAKQAKIFD